MKKDCFLKKANLLPITFTLLLLLGFAQNLFAQVATYTLTSGTGGSGAASATGTSANVTAGSLISGAQMQSPSYNSSGYRIKTNSLAWPTGITNDYGFDIPLSPKTNYDFTLTGITANINNQSYASSSTNLFINIYYQVDGTGAWRKLNGANVVAVTTTTTSINFGSVSESFYSGHTYLFRFYMYASAGSDKNDNYRIRDLVFNGTTSTPPAAAPIVTTGSISGITKYVANVAGTYSVGTGFRNTLVSGIVWSTSTNPTVINANKTTNGSLGVINSTLTGLTAGTTYYTRAYAITQLDTVYGVQKTFTTLPPTVPSITTTAVTNVLSNKATSGGSGIDSGGYAVLEKGICWATTTGPTTANFKNNEGSGDASFTSIMKSLAPNTTYYVRAYARNTLGTGYGNEISFTTSAAVPAITAIPSTINFGNTNFAANTPSTFYVLSANYLTPAAGNLTITVPATSPFKISLSSNGTYTNTLTIPYSASVLANTKVYVQMATTNYGSFSSFIAHSGGGALASNTDTVFVSGTIVQDPNVLTNTGTDFWTGFGYQEKMSQKAGSSGEAKLSIYISVPSGTQNALVNVDLPGIPGASGFPKTGLSIAPNTVTEVTGFPTGSSTDEMNPTGLPDTRLYYTGISNRGIHIYSTNGVPISVWIHSYTTGNSAAGAMLFPTSTWNSSYSVQAYGGQSNNANPNSFFFVIANEDNTPIWFTPSNDILDSSSASIFSDNHVAANVKYPKGVTQGPIFLNKGQVFNAMGFIQGNGSGIGAGKATGLDLSGTTIKTNCDKRIAVFAGNGRCLINATGCSASSGSDHMIQQMFPKVAWGTKYLTVPTKTMEFNLYRINVDDPTTQVWVNNPLHTTPLTGLINNQYYEIQGSSPNIIESDKPINVTQFIVAGGCANQNGSKGNGDPEMIILSPLQQAINKTTVYSAGIKNPSASYNGHYINVIIKRAGVASFKLDNLSVADTGINQATASATTCYNTGGSISIQNAFVQHPGDTSYYYAKFKVSPLTSHTLASDYPFNAIAYGMGDGESYGYNAGTAVKNLSSINVAENPFGTDTSTTSVKTCVNNPVRLKVALPFLPYQVDSIRWDAGTDTLITPNGIKRGALTLNTFTPAPLDSMAQYDATISVEGRTYYIYSSPVLYTFKQNGTYTLKATAYGTFVSDCGSTSTSTIQVEVGQDNIAFTAVPGACGSTSVTFTDATTPMTGTTIQQWQWTFGDGQTSTSTPPNGNPVPNPHVYPPTSSGVSSYWAKLKTINSVGCYSQDSVFIDLSFNLKASFVASKDTICAGSSVTFTDQSTSNAVAWFWDWNDGTKDTVYATAPAPAISHTFNTAGTFNVKLFVKNSTGCISNIKDTNIVVIAKPVVDFQTPAGICLGGSMQFTNLSTPTTGVTYLWNFNDPAATGSNPNTSTLQNPTHIYTTSGPFNVSLTVTNTQYGCTDTKIKTLSSTIYQLPTAIINAPTSACLKDSVQFNDASTGGSGNTVTQWSWNFGDGGTSTLQNPKHAYLSTGNKTVTLVVTSDKGCTSTATTHIINIKPIPDVVHTAIPNICANAAAVSITQFTESTGMTGGTWVYTGTGVSGNTFNPLTAGVGTYNIVATYTAPNGCKDNDTASITVWPLPQVDFTIGATTCEKAPISFTSNTTPNSASMQAWSWNFGDATGIVTTPNATHTYANAGPYNVVLSVTNSNGCSNSISKPITVRSRPFASFTLPGNVCLPAGLATFTSNSTVADDANPSHSWNFGDPNNATGSSLPVATHTYSSTGPFNVTLTITSQYGCVKDTTQVFNTIYPQPPADFTALPFEVCLGDSVKFIGQAANNAVSWSWILDDGNTSADANVTYTYTQARKYQVTYSYTDNRGCVSASVTKTVTVHALPIVDAGPQLWVLQGRTIQLQATAAGNVQDFLWQVSNAAPYLNYDTLLNPLCTPLTDEMYVLQGTGTGGCVAKDTTYVRILKTPVIPNAFSPNGDGVNDTWEIGYLNNYAGCTIEVFNRNGQPVFNSIGYSKNWDGTYKGKPLPVGTYYYVINPKSGHPVMTGYVTILK